MTDTPNREQIKAATARLFQDMASALSAGLIYVGVETGLFRAMHGRGPLDAAAVAAAAGLQPAYVSEWLNGMTANGYLHHDPAAATFELPAEYGYLLASDDSDHFAGGLFYMAPPLLGAAPGVAAAFTDGGGVAFEQYGAAGVDALDKINRGNYLHRLSQYWLQALPQTVATLERGGHALDFGCGSGWASIALARAFPNAVMHGLDQDRHSITRARDNATAAGVNTRTSFIHGGLDDDELHGAYDLVTLFDCLHDLTRPLEVLRTLRQRLAPGGVLFVAEPRAADTLEENCHPVGAMFYGFSVFHCMTQSLAAGGPGFGTCMGPARVKGLLREAGFEEPRLLPVKSQVNQFYAATAAAVS